MSDETPTRIPTQVASSHQARVTYDDFGAHLRVHDFGITVYEKTMGGEERHGHISLSPEQWAELSEVAKIMAAETPMPTEGEYMLDADVRAWQEQNRAKKEQQ